MSSNEQILIEFIQHHFTGTLFKMIVVSTTIKNVSVLVKLDAKNAF